MTSLLRYLLVIAAVNIRATFTFYVKKDRERLIYFSDTEITVNAMEYRLACLRVRGSPVRIGWRDENDLVFASYSGSEAYMIGHFGPLTSGDFTIFEGYGGSFSNFENETAARSGDFGIAYIDYPNNWWKVAPLMGQRKMRYICYVPNPCKDSPCPENDRTQCVINSTTGWYHCEYSVTVCNAGVVCLHGGTCIDQAEGYSCQCRENYIGKHCEVFDACWSNPCQHGGTCTNLYLQSRHSGRRYSCQCSEGFLGLECQYVASNSMCYVGRCPYGMQCIESSQSAYCVAQDKNRASMCVSSAIAERWLRQYVFNSEFVNHLSQYLRPYVNVSGSMSCGCSDVTPNACQYDVNGCVSTNPCQNYGVCLDRIHGYECECRSSANAKLYHFGFHCETLHGRCDPNPCQNGGTCVIDGGRTSCSCKFKFEGDFCQNIIHCESDPCFHGECIEEMHGYRYCNCRGTGYTGPFCEVNVDDCYSSPCRHGVCIDELRKYHCDCSDTGYTGENCEVDINECASNPCLHGNCTDKLNKYKCNCYSGFTGEHCDIFGQCASDPCQNNGTCLFDLANNSYQCDCADEFAGPHCELVVIELVVSKAPVDATEPKVSDELIVTESVVTKAPGIDATESKDSDELIVTEPAVNKAPGSDATESKDSDELIVTEPADGGEGYGKFVNVKNCRVCFSKILKAILGLEL